MTCTCSCHDTPGHRINRRASIGARLVELREQIPEVEKLARSTPPKTLLAARARVDSAKLALPRLYAERDKLNDEMTALTYVAGEKTRHE